MNCHELRSIFDGLGIESFSYSGRGMYGKKCLAINPGSFNLFELGGIVAQSILDYYTEDGKLDLEWMADTRTDSLGKGIVLYFPEIAWEEDDEDEESE